jgi:hypothetical protein
MTNIRRRNGGWRWSEEAATCIKALAWAKPRSSPELLTNSVAAALRARWSGLPAVAAQRAFAASLLELPMHEQKCVDGRSPPSPTCWRRLSSASSPPEVSSPEAAAAAAHFHGLVRIAGSRALEAPMRPGPARGGRL